jgi:hypothetical protein
MRMLLAIASLLAGCGSGSEVAVEPELAVVRTLQFIREAPEGVSEGLDLDGFVSESNDGRSCFKPDFVSPAGIPGIDNQLATLLPLVDIAGENAVESLVQQSINEGRLLMIIEITSRGSTADVRVLRGMDVPLLGADGRILPGQTLGLDAAPLLGAIEGVPIGDGPLVTDTFDLLLPIQVFSQLYEIDMPKAQLRFTMDVDGSITGGLITGGIPIEQLLTVLRTASEFAGDFEALFGDAIRDSGDLERDEAGSCTSMSAAVAFDAVQAFTF